LRQRKSFLMRELLPHLEIALPETGSLNLSLLFKTTPIHLCLEVGFGGGEHLAARAQQHPTFSFIGCEPFVNGIASLLDHIDREHIENIRIYPNDARLLLDALPDESLERCFVLFADPWPKARHAERRFIGPHSLPRLARVMQKGSELLMATDHPGLAEHIRLNLRESDAFHGHYDAQVPPLDWVPTRYEEKGIKAGRQPAYFSYRRL